MKEQHTKWAIRRKFAEGTQYLLQGGDDWRSGEARLFNARSEARTFLHKHFGFEHPKSNPHHKVVKVLVTIEVIQ